MKNKPLNISEEQSVQMPMKTVASPINRVKSIKGVTIPILSIKGPTSNVASSLNNAYKKIAKAI